MREVVCGPRVLPRLWRRRHLELHKTLLSDPNRNPNPDPDPTLPIELCPEKKAEFLFCRKSISRLALSHDTKSPPPLSPSLPLSLPAYSNFLKIHVECFVLQRREWVSQWTGFVLLRRDIFRCRTSLFQPPGPVPTSSTTSCSFRWWRRFSSGGGGV